MKGNMSIHLQMYLYDPIEFKSNIWIRLGLLKQKQLGGWIKKPLKDAP